MGELFTLPFAGENEVFSIFGNRDCNGDGKWDAAKHGGWDIRPPKVCGVVPEQAGFPYAVVWPTPTVEG